MRNSILKKAIPAVLMGAISVSNNHGMEIIQPTNGYPGKKFLIHIDKGNFTGFGAPSLLKEFKSERLAYCLPDKQMKKDIIRLVSDEQISKTLFSTSCTQTPEKIFSSRFWNNKTLSRINATGNSSSYSLPDGLLWGVTSTLNNQLVGFIEAEYITPRIAEKRAPEGDMHQFYVDDIKKNPYVNISYAVSPEHQRQGYATEMSLALIEILFQHTNTEVIVHISIEANVGSAKSANTCCFLEKGLVDGENFRILRKSSQLRLLDGSEQPKGISQLHTEKRQRLEILVFDLVKKNGIGINLLDTSNLNNGHSGPCCIGRDIKKLPQDIEELHNWCAKGYQFGENEKSLAHMLWGNSQNGSLTEQYSFQLFLHGIQYGGLPLIQYVLEYHNNFWDRKNLGRELQFSLENNCYTMITYLIKRNFLEIFDYVIKSEDFRDFTFGPGMKNAMGNTPFHTLAKYGSQEMIARFLEEKDLVDLCLNADNIKGEKGLNPLQIAESLEKPEEILNHLREAIATNNSMNIDKNRSI